MALIKNLFSKSPFLPIVEHAKLVHECVELIHPLLEALVNEDYEQIRKLHHKISKIEHEADLIKHEIRRDLPRRFFLPVAREELDGFLQSLEKLADYAEDFSVILLIRKTKLHPALHDSFFKFVNQIFQATGTLLTAAVELNNLAEVSFSGAEANLVLDRIKDLSVEEWQADRLARELSILIYELEDELNPVDIFFYEKLILKLSAMANEAENAGDYLRAMIIKS